MLGKSLLHYEIKDQIGKGGMGEVFRARDTKLGRDVALKILPAELSGDPEREVRFQREARALASLQHHNVASVYGFEEVDGVRFLIMELIEGVELTVRMKQGAVPVAEVLSVARQIAAGLEAAHENGIVHRDLKPANIMETAEGEVKILDFGLAQAWFGDEASQQDSATSPTMTAAMTQVGAILGTAAYMSPEQARGVGVDRRTDIWAFGVILFEMLTGKPLFQGETISDTLAAVLRAEPDWDALPVAEAPELCRLIERCLERNPRQRLRDIGEARIFLQDGGASGSNLSFSRLGMTAAPEQRAPAARPVGLLAVVAVASLIIGGLLGWQVLSRPQPAPVLHAMLPPPAHHQYQLAGAAPGPAVVSPDGTMVAFTAVDEEGQTLLYLRHLDQGESLSMAGTGGAAYPFWSPDSRFIGFFVPTQNKLKKVAAAGGPPVTLCAAENGKGGSWNARGDIVFAPSASSAIYRVPDIGGEPVRLNEVDPEYNSYRHPRFLPDGERYIFIGRPTTSDRINDVFLAALDTTVAPRVISRSQAHADYADGYLLTVRENVLMATTFAADQAEVTAGGIPLVENILSVEGAALGVFSAAVGGMLVYQTGSGTGVSRMLLWTDIATGKVEPLGEPGQLYHPVIAPDGRQAVVEVRDASREGTDLWLVDLATGLRTRFTFAPGDESDAVWSADGESVFYRSADAGTFRVMQQPVAGQGGATILVEASRDVSPTSVSATDPVLLLNYEREDGKFDIRRLALDDADGEATPFIAANDRTVAGGVFSPDGRWVAYFAQSASGWDVFVVAAAGGARKWQVTTEGAVFPNWNRAGTDLWVSLFDGKLRSYAVDGSGETFQVGRFTVRAPQVTPEVRGSHYDLDPAGGRLLQSATDPAFRAETSFVHLVTDWRRGLGQ